MDESSFIVLHKLMVRPYLEYANSVWCPFEQGNIKEVEKIKKKATKLVINFTKQIIQRQTYTVKSTSIEM